MRVLDWGFDDNRAYIATDPPRGVTLQYVIDNENINLKRSIDLVRQLLMGIKTLHEQGIYGLDLRPQLITVETIGITDRVQVDDIGLRMLLLSLGYMSSQQSSDIGFLDPRYCPPEYINNGQIGPWSDIYQAGLLLFTLVTGRLPFVGRTPAETGMLQKNNPIPSIQQYKYDTPSALQELIEKALAKDPTRRFPNVDAFINTLNLIIPSPTGNIQTTEMPEINAEDLAATIPPQSLELPLTRQPEISELPTATGIYAYLCFEYNSSDIERFPITEKDIVVGRQDPKRGIIPDIDLSNVDPRMTVSRHHAHIRFKGTFFEIEDLTSHNGTRLRELKLTPAKAEVLQHGDTVQFGSVRMTFEIPGAG
jgi:serine/threonine protein kinase